MKHTACSTLGRPVFVLVNDEDLKSHFQDLVPVIGLAPVERRQVVNAYRSIARSIVACKPMDGWIIGLQANGYILRHTDHSPWNVSDIRLWVESRLEQLIRDGAFARDRLEEDRENIAAQAN